MKKIIKKKEIMMKWKVKKSKENGDDEKEEKDNYMENERKREVRIHQKVRSWWNWKEKKKNTS